MEPHLDDQMLQPILRNLQNVERLDYQSGLDSTGDPAAWIWIIMRADAPESAWEWDNRQKLRTYVREKLQEAGFLNWVYVRFRSADEGAVADYIRSATRH